MVETFNKFLWDWLSGVIRISPVLNDQDDQIHFHPKALLRQTVEKNQVYLTCVTSSALYVVAFVDKDKVH